MYDLEQAIRERAYHLWIESGCEEGQAEHHWLAAQRSILGEQVGAREHAAEVPTKPKKARAPRKKRAA